MKSLINKINNNFNRFLIKLSNDSRPDSYPYISGDGFRKMTDHIYDETGKCSPENIETGQIVFVKSDMLIDFFENCHPKINNHYKLISHNGDINIDEKYLKYIDDKIIHWFAQNLMIEHPKITVIPIGLENKHIYLHGIPKVFNKLQNVVTEKKDRILFGFNPKTNLEIREPALRHLRENELANEVKNLNSREYLRELNQYKYVASPPGNGVDCHRTWEAIVLGVIPVCLNNTNTELLIKQLNSPILKTDNYKNINLKEVNGNRDIIFFNYWKKIIKNK